MDNKIFITSGICKESDFTQPWFKFWIEAIQQKPIKHRKQWEFAVIAQALYERGLLSEGKKGLGFAVGTEPLPALFAKQGAEILATDLSPDHINAQAWTLTNQHISNATANLFPNICPNNEYNTKVKSAYVDMNHITSELRNFDFTWSACALEHLGSIKKGKEFLLNQMKCLKPGGWAIHTTELNIGSDTDTIDNEMTVLFLKKNIEDIIIALRKEGHFVEAMNWDQGNYFSGEHVDVPTNYSDPHLRLVLGKYVTTSMVLVIRKRKFTQDNLIGKKIGKLVRKVWKKKDTINTQNSENTILNLPKESAIQEYNTNYKTQLNSVYVGNNIVLARIFTGQLIYVNTKDAISMSPHIIMNGEWEMWTTHWILKFLKEDTVFLEIGANWGFFSLVARSVINLKKGNIIAFEPNPEICKLLRRSFEINSILSSNVRQVALGDKKGDVILKRDADHWAGATIIDDDFTATKEYKVQQTTLDDELKALNISKVDLISLDTEGAEEMILNGANLTIKNNPNLVIICEFTPNRYSDPHSYYSKIEKQFSHIYMINEDKSIKELHSYTELIALIEDNLTNLILTNSEIS